MSKNNNKDWYYLSFANPKFEGAYIVQGTSIKDAQNTAIGLGANPAWHVVGVNINALNAPMPHPAYLNRPLSLWDVEHMEVGGVAGAKKIGVCADCIGDGEPLEITPQ